MTTPLHGRTTLNHQTQQRLLDVLKDLREQYKRSYIVNAIDRLLPIVGTRSDMTREQMQDRMTTWSAGEPKDENEALIRMMQETVRSWWGFGPEKRGMHGTIKWIELLEYIAHPLPGQGSFPVRHPHKVEDMRALRVMSAFKEMF